MGSTRRQTQGCVCFSWDWIQHLYSRKLSILSFKTTSWYNFQKSKKKTTPLELNPLATITQYKDTDCITEWPLHHGKLLLAGSRLRAHLAKKDQLAETLSVPLKHPFLTRSKVWLCNSVRINFWSRWCFNGSFVWIFEWKRVFKAVGEALTFHNFIVKVFSAMNILFLIRHRSKKCVKAQNLSRNYTLVKMQIKPAPLKWAWVCVVTLCVCVCVCVWACMSHV